MATNSADVLNAAEPVRWSFTRFADRWIFVFTAALFVATTLAGFVPESILRKRPRNSGWRAEAPHGWQF
jgi:hypothetical protein